MSYLPRKLPNLASPPIDKRHQNSFMKGFIHLYTLGTDFHLIDRSHPCVKNFRLPPPFNFNHSLSRTKEVTSKFRMTLDSKILPLCVIFLQESGIVALHNFLSSVF